MKTSDPIITVTRLILLLTAAAVVLWALWRMDIDEFVAETTAAGPLPFFAALAVLPAIGFPTTPLFLLAGAAFGVGVGLLGCMASMAINLAIVYWLAGGYLRRTLEAMLLVKFRYTLPNLSHGGAWRFALLVKLAPGVPTFIKNYLLGIAGVPAKVYFGVLWPLTTLYAGAVIVLGDSLHDHDYSMTVVAVVLLIALIVLLKLVRNRWRDDEREQEASGNGEAEQVEAERTTDERD